MVLSALEWPIGAFGSKDFGNMPKIPSLPSPCESLLWDPSPPHGSAALSLVLLVTSQRCVRTRRGWPALRHVPNGQAGHPVPQPTPACKLGKPCTCTRGSGQQHHSHGCYWMAKCRMCARAGKNLGALEKSLVCKLMKGGTNYNLLVCMSRIRDSIQILSVLCTQKNEVILLKPLTLWEDWRLPSLAARTSSWLCSQHTSCIYTADWDWFQDFLWSALVLSLQGLFSAFHYSLMNAATHHLPEEQNCWSVTWL